MKGDSTANVEFMKRSRCKNTPHDLFFPENPDPNPELTQQVIEEFCQGCCVQQDCLMYALEYEEYGVWGGFTEQQRKEFKRIIKEGNKCGEK